ncbi:ABC transporter substrate-binding protein [Paradesulfitobacterium aromaticivorans]
MLKKRTGILIILLALFSALLVNGCAKSSTENKTQTNGNSKTPIKIGLIVDLSGPGADLGEYESRGAQLCVEEYNGKAGVVGRPIELIVRDGKGSSSEAVNQARDLLYSQNVDFIMTGTNSSYALAVSDMAKQAKKIMFSENANDAFTMESGHQYAFRVPNITALTQAYSASKYAVEKFPEKKRYYFIAHDYAFGRTVIDDFKKDIKKLNPSVEFVGESYVKLDETNYNSYITAIQQAQPDVVYFAWQTGVPFFKQAAPYQLSQKIQLLSGYWGGVQDMMTLSKADLPLNAVVGGIPWYGLQNKENQDFVAAFQKKYNVPPKPSAYFDYMSMQVLMQGITKAGTIDTDKVIKALEGLDAETIIGKVQMRAFDHQGAAPYWLGTVKWDDKLNTGVISNTVQVDTNPALPTAAEIEQMRKNKK